MSTFLLHFLPYCYHDSYEIVGLPALPLQYDPGQVFGQCKLIRAGPCEPTGLATFATSYTIPCGCALIDTNNVEKTTAAIVNYMQQ